MNRKPRVAAVPLLSPQLPRQQHQEQPHRKARPEAYSTTRHHRHLRLRRIAFQSKSNCRSAIEQHHIYTAKDPGIRHHGANGGRLGRHSPREVLLAGCAIEYLDYHHVGGRGHHFGRECAVYDDTESDRAGDALVSATICFLLRHQQEETGDAFLRLRTITDKDVNTNHINRIMPYGVTVGALTLLFVVVEVILIAQRRLLPGIMMLLSFILFVLFLTGAVGTGIQLFGKAQINQQCNRYVFNQKSRGPSERTLAFLQQQNICERTCILGNSGGMWLTELQANAGKPCSLSGLLAPCSSSG